MSGRSRGWRAACAGAIGWSVVAAAASAGGFRSPEAGAALRAGDTVAVAWEAPCDRAETDEIELVLSVDDGMTFQVRVTPELSACARRFEWRVPDLPTTTGRLALRIGREGDRGSERIVTVSHRFTIVPSGDTGAALSRGAIEWWTDQALFDVTVEDWLDGSMRCCPAWHAASDSAPDADESGPAPLPSPASDRDRHVVTAAARRPLFPGPSRLRLPAPVPMRV